MTAAVKTAPEVHAEVERPIEWKMPIVYGIMTLIVVGVFWLLTPSGVVTHFLLASPGDFFQIPNFSLPSKLTAGICAAIAVLAFAYLVYLAMNRQKIRWWVHLVFGLAFVFGFLVFVAADNPGSVTLTTLLTGGLALSVPLIFGSMCGLVGERSGIVNIAIEGQLLLGAFFAAVAASVFKSPYVGLISAPLAGALVGAILVFFAVKYWVDQIIIGVVLNVLVLGLTNFFYSTVLTHNKVLLNQPMPLPKLPIPVLSQIPVIGPVFFNQTILVYLMYLIVILLHIYVFRSRWGLRMRAVGEHPKAADTVGIAVNPTRVRNTILAGAIAGLGGASFTVGVGLAFGQDMSAGQGFIALAAMILGKWNPLGALAASVLFGFSLSVVNLLSTIGTPIPSEILKMLPYAITILAVAGFVGRVRAPAAENIPYIK